MKATAQEHTDLLFCEEAFLTGITEFGISWEDVLNGIVKVPPQGARFDIAFEGTFAGPDIRGVLKGVDFLEIRADGRFMPDIRATLVTHDGETVALHEDGLLIPDPLRPGLADLRLTMMFSTASAQYHWMNNLHAWAVGELNIMEAMALVRVYA